MQERGPGDRYQGKRVLLIGASGIGAAFAVRVAAEGAEVHVADIDSDALAETLLALGGGHGASHVDVRSTASVARALREAEEAGDSLDALVVVAGGDEAHGTFEETGDEVWRSLHELNVLGPVRVVRAALPLLRRAGDGAAIALVSSVNARLTLGSEPYSAAKAALGPVVRNLAATLAVDAIRVNAVLPATLRTRVWDDQGGPDRLAAHYPLQRVGEPEDVAAALAFLCSSDAAWITGVLLPVDGGLSVRSAFH